MPLFIDNPILAKEQRRVWGKNKEVLNRGEEWGGVGWGRGGGLFTRTYSVAELGERFSLGGEGHILILLAYRTDMMFIYGVHFMDKQ